MSPQEIRERRLAIPLTIVELAARVGVSVPAVRAWEAGRRAPQPKYVRALVAAFASQDDCGGVLGGCACRCHQTTRRAWSPAEDEFLAQAVERGDGAEAIAAAITEAFGQRRTRIAVAQRAADRGLSFRSGWYSREDVRRLLGVGDRALRLWWDAGLLRASRHVSNRRGRESRWWRIEPDDLEAFVDRYAGIKFDPARVTDPALRSRAEAAARNRRSA